MPISVTKHLKINSGKFTQTGAFDAILDVDSRFFINPLLLKYVRIPEFQDSYSKLESRFRNILKLLRNSTLENDAFWRQAERFFCFPEVNGLCIGYSDKGTSGSGMGPKIRQQILSTAKIIVDAGIDDPSFFEIMGLFEEGIGSDRISDMIASIIIQDIATYSSHIFKKFHITGSARYFGNTCFELPANPYSGHPILLIPKDILSNLPVVYDWEDIEIAADHNNRLRQRINDIVGAVWVNESRQKRRPSKRQLRDIIRHNPSFITLLLDGYSQTQPTPYDFDSDPEGEVVWLETSRQMCLNYPLALYLPQNPVATDVMVVVTKICKHFTHLVEDCGLCSLLYNDNGKPKPESATQKLFYGIADAYCKANNLDISPESNSGRGPVDFKISRGYNARVLVETKLTTNTHLVHGFEKQVNEYQKAENTRYSIYLVVDVQGGSRTARERLLKSMREAANNGYRLPEILFADAIPKESASKYSLEKQGQT